MFDIKQAKLNGMSCGSIKIMEEYNKNIRKKRSCKMHDFETTDSINYHCKSCGYKADVAYVNGYNDALRHAREL